VEAFLMKRTKAITKRLLIEELELPVRGEVVRDPQLPIIAERPGKEKDENNTTFGYMEEA